MSFLPLSARDSTRTSINPDLQKEKSPTPKPVECIGKCPLYNASTFAANISKVKTLFNFLLLIVVLPSK